jgi:hypothetical protein
MKNLINTIFILVAVAVVISCTDMDEYLKYTNGKDLIYTGKVDSVRVHSGKNRVLIKGLMIADPKISKVKIFWNTRKDSLILDIERTAGVDTLKVPIDLPEGRYNFEIITFDNAGNHSVTVNASGTSYGNTYQESLINRPIKTAEKIGNNGNVSFYNADETALYSEITYTDANDVEHVLTVDNSVSLIELVNIKPASKFKYQTFYLPDPKAVDVFASTEQMIGFQEDVTAVYIKNAGRYIVRGDNGTGKWGLPKDWLYNAGVVNQNGGTAGGWSWDDGGVIHMETQDWGGAGVSNGKIWQTFTLPEGTYTLSIETGYYGGGDYEVNEIVAVGTTLPDINDLGTPLAIFKGNPSNLGGTHSLTFTLDEPTTVSAGWVVNTGQYVYLQFRTIRLVVKGSGF